MSYFREYQIYGKKDIVRRYAGNPILDPKKVPFPCQGIYNSGITKFRGKYLMICRVGSIDINDVFVKAWSDDGIHFNIEDRPINLPDTPEFRKYTNLRIYDPRVTRIGDTYYLAYAAGSDFGTRVGLLITKDFETFDYKFISEPDNRNGVLFPEKIDGMFVRLDRPNATGDIWIAYSPDLEFWGRQSCVLTKSRQPWNWARIGAGAVPIKTDEGWLIIYHGLHLMVGYVSVYHLSVALLDLENPAKVIAAAKAPILSPVEPYECMGLATNVVFTAGAILEDDGEVKIYYGGADTVQCLATARLEDLIWACHNR